MRISLHFTEEGNIALCTDEETGPARSVNLAKSTLTTTGETGFQSRLLWFQGVYSFGAEEGQGGRGTILLFFFCRCPELLLPTQSGFICVCVWQDEAPRDFELVYSYLQGIILSTIAGQTHKQVFNQICVPENLRYFQCIICLQVPGWWPSEWAVGWKLWQIMVLTPV